MKKIIDGVFYDTDKAEVIASASEGYEGDFGCFSESLYRTAKGNWFLAGEGGPLSKYCAASTDGSYSGGSKIFPMSPKAAREWLEINNEVDLCLKYFSEEIEEA